MGEFCLLRDVWVQLCSRNSAVSLLRLSSISREHTWKLNVIQTAGEARFCFHWQKLTNSCQHLKARQQIPRANLKSGFFYLYHPPHHFCEQFRDEKQAGNGFHLLHSPIPLSRVSPKLRDIPISFLPNSLSNPPPMARSISAKRKGKSLQGVLWPLREHFTTLIVFKIHSTGRFLWFSLDHFVMASEAQSPKEKQDLPRKHGRLWGLDRDRIFLNKPCKVPSINHWVCAAQKPKGTWGHNWKNPKLFP